MNLPITSHFGVAREHGITKHTKEILFFNDLVIDLKLQLAGRTPREPISDERMAQADVHLAQLSLCKDRVHFK